MIDVNVFFFASGLDLVRAQSPTRKTCAMSRPEQRKLLSWPIGVSDDAYCVQGELRDDDSFQNRVMSTGKTPGPGVCIVCQKTQVLLHQAAVGHLWCDYDDEEFSSQSRTQPKN
jgi:hypothetical protein